MTRMMARVVAGPRNSVRNGGGHRGALAAVPVLPKMKHERGERTQLSGGVFAVHAAACPVHGRGGFAGHPLPRR
jgi:hypothetical protein